MSDEQRISQAQKVSSIGVPIAIVIAAGLIAGAIVFSSIQKKPVPPTDTLTKPSAQETPEIIVAPVTEADHIQGNPNAPIIFVEYSDYECPFCKNFHETMDRIISEYGTTGKIAWVYRHFPLEQLHPNAPKIAEASECVAKLGGNDAFWKFSDLVFGERETNAQTDILKLPNFATQAGVNREAYIACMNSNTFTQTIIDDTAEAVATGARGTPYSFLIAGNQKQVINGAQPYENIKRILDTLIAQIDASATQ